MIHNNYLVVDVIDLNIIYLIHTTSKTKKSYKKKTQFNFKAYLIGVII